MEHIFNFVQDMLRKWFKRKRWAKMRKAAEMMADEYLNDSELTALTALNGDEIFDATTD